MSDERPATKAQRDARREFNLMSEASQQYYDLDQWRIRHAFVDWYAEQAHAVTMKRAREEYEPALARVLASTDPATLAEVEIVRSALKVDERIFSRVDIAQWCRRNAALLAELSKMETKR